MAPFSGVIVQGLKIVVGCEDQPDQNPVIVAQNSDGNILLTFLDENGEIVDISGATAIEMSFLEADGSTILTKTLTSGIQLVANKYNQALVSFVAADFALLPEGLNDAQVKLVISSVNYIENMYACLDVEPAAV